jgi:protein-S-isoprenylcysteine O-methyltransferase Ste14
MLSDASHISNPAGMQVIARDIGMTVSTPALGLALLALFGVLAVGLRMAVQLRRTGSTGFKGLHHAGPVERIGGSLFAIALVLCIAGPVLQLAGVLNAIDALHGEGAKILGVVFASVGIVSVSIAQFAMGDAWRIGVDPAESTGLVTHGPFAVVRNPIYAAMIPAFTGIALLAPNAVTLAGAVLLVVALELQTRLVEEPYLAVVHGERYTAYAAQVGRFLPGVGRLHPGT